MKHIITITALLFCVHSSYAQSVENKMQETTIKEQKEKSIAHPALIGKKTKRVPEAVSISFSALFPEAQAAQWYKKDNLFRVQFLLRAQSHIAVFDESGKRMD